MKSIIRAANAANATNDYEYHTFIDTEFSGVFENYKIKGYIYEYEYGHIFNIHIFIRNGTKVYMDVKGIGYVVITFGELQTNKYWKFFYDLSLLLTNNKHLTIHNLKYMRKDSEWSIDTGVFVSNGFKDKTEILYYNKHFCYLGINPYTLDNMNYTSQEDLQRFNKDYLERYDTSKKMFDKKSTNYYNLAIEYCASIMEKELNSLSAFFEDKKNILNLATLSDKQGMNSDILGIIYNKLAISPEGYHKYKEFIENIEGCKNRLELHANILEA
jgi:hypothetical protein